MKLDEPPEKPSLPTEITERTPGAERRIANLRPFAAGVSGNPGGRSKSEMQVAVNIRARLPELTDALFSIALSNRTATVARVRAIEVLLERGLGKAPQKMVVETDLTGMSDGELQRLIHQQLAEWANTIEGQADAAE